MKYKFISLTNPNWNARSSEMRAKLGVTSHKWPREGISPRMVDGIKVWVTPAREPTDWKGRRTLHRVMCECPGCGDHLSAGRLHQHDCNAKRRRV